MAINVYTGLMGSGKSYEVVSSVILPAVLAGRRVVANIDGLNQEKIHEYLLEENPNHEGELGEIVLVDDLRLKQPNFFPDEKKPDAEAVVKPGDLVVVDEAWRFWSTGEKLLPEHMQFFRMHRHYTHEETGLSCDLALVFQAITDVHRSLRSVIEINFKTTKMKKFGLHQVYRVDFWEGGKQTKNAFIGNRVTRYSSKIFPLYKSYAGEGGNETVVDDRQNVFNNKKLWYMIPILLVLFSFSAYFLYSFFNSTTTEPKKADEKLEVTEPKKVNNDPVQNLVGGLNKEARETTKNKRIAGMVNLPLSNFVVVTDKEGRLEFDTTYNYTGNGVFMKGEHKGERVDTKQFVK